MNDRIPWSETFFLQDETKSIGFENENICYIPVSLI